LASEDDPVIGELSIDYESCIENENVLLGVTKRGGHVAYFENILSSK